MYTEESISTLNERIKWNASLDSEFSIELSEDNKTGTSGKHFQSFHNLVSIDNIYASVPEIAMDEEDFNDLLTDIRLQATLQVINDVMDRNDLYLPNTDYDNLMISNAGLFDSAIGFKVAISVLEMFLSTTRINLHERNAKLSASNLKLELEGFINDNGIIVAKGIKNLYNSSVKKATNKLFPIQIIVRDGKAW